MDNLKVQVSETFLQDGKEEDGVKKSFAAFKEETSKRIRGRGKSL